MIQFAATSGISLREYAATLTALIQANGRAASAQVGDGAVAGWMLTSEPQRGEHASETWFITQEGAIYRRCVSAEIIGVQRVMVGAEGMMGLTLKQPGNVRYAPYFDGALSWLESDHSRGKASGRCRTLLLGNQVRLLTDDDVTMIQATLLHTATETEDQPQKDRSHHGKEAEYSTGSTA